MLDKSSKRDYDSEIAGIIADHLKGDMSAAEIAGAVEKEIEDDRSLVLYLTRPKLYAVLMALVTGEIHRFNMRKTRKLRSSMRDYKAKHIPASKMKRALTDNLFDRYYYNRRLGDWTCGELLAKGHQAMVAARTHIQFAELSIMLGELGRPDQKVRDLGTKAVLDALQAVGLDEDELPRE